MDEYIKREDALKSTTYFGLTERTDIVSLTLLTAQKHIKRIPAADVAPKSEVACEIIDEILEGLQYEIDTEDKRGRSAWDEGDTVGHHIHQYAEEKLDTLKTVLSIYKKKYTETGE